MYKILSTFLLWAVLSAAIAAPVEDSKTPLALYPITINLPCGPTEVVFLKLKDDMRLAPILSGSEMVDKIGIITTVWVSQWESDQSSVIMAITETTTKGLTCIILTTPNVVRFQSGQEM